MGQGWTFPLHTPSIIGETHRIICTVSPVVKVIAYLCCCYKRKSKYDFYSKTACTTNHFPPSCPFVSHFHLPSKNYFYCLYHNSQCWFTLQIIKCCTQNCSEIEFVFLNYLENPHQQSIRSPPIASSLLCSPHANAGMKQYKGDRTQPLFRVGHDHGINMRSKPEGLRQC